MPLYCFVECCTITTYYILWLIPQWLWLILFCHAIGNICICFFFGKEKYHKKWPTYIYIYMHTITRLEACSDIRAGLQQCFSPRYECPWPTDHFGKEKLVHNYTPHQKAVVQQWSSVRLNAEQVCSVNLAQFAINSPFQQSIQSAIDLMKSGF